MSRALVLCCLFFLSACREHLHWLGYAPDAGELPDSGLPPDPDDAGEEPLDAGTDAGFEPFDDTAALRTCARVDACLQGADFGNGIRGEWFPICVQTLAAPMPTAEELHQASSLGAHLNGWFLPTPIWLVFPGVRTCLASAVTCEQVVNCFNFGTAPPACNDINGTVKCDGSVMTVCTAPSVNFANQNYPAPTQLHAYSVDCATTGGTCVPPASASQPGAAGCAAAPCTGTSERCIDSLHHERCQNGRLDIMTCTGGTTCSVGSNTGCTSAASCDPTTFHGSCGPSGEVTSCVARQFMTGACQAGTTCQMSGAGTAFCGVASDCAPLDEIPLCESSGALKVCSFGRWRTIPCADVGFSTCAAPDLVLRHGAVCR